MKVGKVPVASLVLIIFFSVSALIKYFYPAQYLANTQFIDGAFFGAAVVYALYYINIFYTAWMKNRREAENNSTL
jgi:hypothetical protein